MIKNVDLDVRNHYEKHRSKEEVLVYVRADLDDNDMVNIIWGDDIEIMNILLEQKELYDIFLNVAAHIVTEKKIDFNEILEGIK